MLRDVTDAHPVTPAASHHAAIVLDAHRADALGITHDEAEAVAIEADVLDGKHRGGFLAWVADVLHDIRSGRRDRNGRRK